MYYGSIKTNDIANGPGVRVSLFVSGCRNRCKGCFNPETWDFEYGKPFTTDDMCYLYRLLRQDHISGLTILGGDPFEPENIKVVTYICEIIKYFIPKKSIWIYTGYKYENIRRMKVMKYIDVLVDGPFEEELKDISLKFRGSSNQRIIDITETKKNKKITLWRG